MAQAQIPNQCQSNRTSPSPQLYRQEAPNWGNVECQKSLKLVLKWEIHNLLQRLSDVGEESVIVTANISDDSTSVLGSHFGEKFVVQSDLDVLKHQFLRYCAVHCKRKSKKIYSPSKRKTADETHNLKRVRKSLHEYSQSPSMDSISPLREMSNGEKEGSIESDISTAVINTLTTPIVPLSKLNSSRRKHTPKKVVPSLPVSQSDSDTEDTNFTVDTIVKVEADDQDEDIYAETNTHFDEYKHDYFDTYKSMDKNDYFDGNALKSGNLSDDSSGGPCTSFLMNEYRNIVGAGKDLLSGYPKSDYLLNRGRDTDSSLKNGPFSGFSNSLESDSDISVIDGLPGDNVSLPDMENFSYSPSMTVSNSYTSLEGDGKLKKTGPGLSKKGGPRASTGFKATYNEDPAETVLLDQSKKGVRQYQCPYCELMVRDRHDLKRHLRTHTKEKPYTCEMCGKKFTRKWDQENHIKKHQETVLREMYLAKEAELQVKHNLDTINKMTMKVKEQQAGLERTPLNITDDSRTKTDLNIGDYSALETKTDVNITDSSANVRDRIALSNGSVLSEEMNGHLLASPVKLEK